MVLKILGRDEKHVKRCSCSNCATKIEYVDNDIVTLWSGTDYGGGPDGAKGFKCPNCGANVILERW